MSATDTARQDYCSYMWSVKDWRSDDVYRLLSTEQKGAYRELIDECWVQKRIPNDQTLLARIAGLTVAAFKRLWKLIKDKFEEIDGGQWLRSRRLELDRGRLDGIRSLRSKAGKVSAQKRKFNTKATHVENVLNKTPTETQPDLQTIQNTEIQSSSLVTVPILQQGSSFENGSIPDEEKTKTKKPKTADADARRVPLKDFMSQEYEEKYSFRPPTDSSDWKQFEDMLKRTRGIEAFDLSPLMEYWHMFLRSPDSTCAHPIRYFSANVSKYAALNNAKKKTGNGTRFTAREESTGETPGSTSAERTRRGDPIYTPRQL